MSDVLVFVLELIGTVAFAVSGAIVGIKKQMDLFGVIGLGICTAVGGGIVRDLILGVTPPVTFQNPVDTLTAAAVSVLMFLPHMRARIGRHEPVFDRLLLVTRSASASLRSWACSARTSSRRIIRCSC